MGSIKLSISPHNTPHIIHTVLSCTLAGVNEDVGIHVYIHMSELCDYGNIVVDVDTIAVLLMRARLVSIIKIKSLYYMVCLHTIMFTNHPHSCIAMVDAIPCCVISGREVQYVSPEVLSL